MTTPVWSPSGFLVNAFTDSDDDPHGLFLTADGTSWEQVADIPGPDIPAMASDGSMTVGFRLPFTESDPPGLTDGAPVYVSPDGRSWEHPTPFSLEKGHVNAATFTPDGRLLMAGSDISGCREFFCVFNIDNGTVPAVWIGEPN